MLQVIPESGPIQRIIYDGVVYAILVRASLPQKGYNFVTEDQESLQVGVNHYAAGDEAKPHFHLPVDRALKDTLEVLHIDSGACQLNLYDQDKNLFYDIRLGTGDTVILIEGGHSLDFIEQTRVLEVKQGPYLGPEKDKVFF